MRRLCSIITNISAIINIFRIGNYDEMCQRHRKFYKVSTDSKKFDSFSPLGWEMNPSFFPFCNNARTFDQRKIRTERRLGADKAPSLPIIIGKHLGLVSCVLTILPDWLGTSLITVTA